MWEQYTLTQVLDVAKFTNPTPLSLLILCKLSFPIVGLKMTLRSIIQLIFHSKTLNVTYLLLIVMFFRQTNY
jgi:hypothetical protein